jgi:hypothetical protein
MEPDRTIGIGMGPIGFRNVKIQISGQKIKAYTAISHCKIWKLESRPVPLFQYRSIFRHASAQKISHLPVHPDRCSGLVLRTGTLRRRRTEARFHPSPAASFREEAVESRIGNERDEFEADKAGPDQGQSREDFPGFLPVRAFEFQNGLTPVLPEMNRAQNAFPLKFPDPAGLGLQMGFKVRG